MIKKLKKNKKNKGFIEIYGLHSTKAALNNKLRKHKKLIISSNIKYQPPPNIRKNIDKIINLSNNEFNKHYGNFKAHQGIVLQTSNLIQPSLEKIIENSKYKKNDLVLMLDHITDPNNIGSIMRSCAAFNCYSLIVSKNNAPDITPSMVKAASGAIEIVNYIKVNNLSQTIDKFKKNNYWIIGLDSNVKNVQKKIELPKKCLLIFGSEGRGLRILTKSKCDQIISIPMKHNDQIGMESLNVSNACAIILYEYFINNSKSK